jgi:hypothetical protein
LFLIKNNLTLGWVAPHSYHRLVITGLIVLPSLEFFGEGDLGHGKQLSQKVRAGG